jgi:trans-aconitate methyltransferase
MTEQAGPDLDTSRPHPARVYDFLLGGKSNFAADRALAEKMLQQTPGLRVAARENRAFLGRAVQYLAGEAGVRQFLDIGTGLPTAGNVHEVAQRIAPESRVVCADNDPMVLAHARALLTSAPEGRTAYVHADLRDPAHILADRQVRDVLDFSQPVALVLVAVLHFLPDEDKPAQVVATLLDALPSGSYLVASHTALDHAPAPVAAMERAAQAGGIRTQQRDSGDFARLAFPGLELVPPGVVLVSEWRPHGSALLPDPAQVNVYGGVARKP